MAAGLALVALTIPAQLINLYFASLMLGRWAPLRRRLSSLFMACGADTSSCAIVVKTPYARIFGGAPNVFLGIAWCLALLGLGLWWMATGRVVVPWPFLVVAAGTVVLGVYLVWVLVRVLKQPCPL